MKQKVHNFLQSNSGFLNLIYVLIVLNVLSVVLVSFKEIRSIYSIAFTVFEIFSVAIFTLEYLARLWTSDLLFDKGSSLSRRLRFAFSWYGLIDLLAILPFFLPLVVKFDLRVLRIIRLFRLLRIFKLGRLSSSMKNIKSVLNETKAELGVTLFVAFILLTLSSTLMYYFENEAQPEVFSNIGQSMWWAVATLTTVGYGDIYPITGIGKFLGAIIALIGIGFVALPTGIISSAFIEKVQNEKKMKVSSTSCECPHCGKKHYVNKVE